MLAAPILAIVLGLMIVGFFFPLGGSIAFLVFIALLEGYLAFGATLNLGPPSARWTLAEREVIRKYWFFFRFPIVARQYSSVISGIQLSAFLWVPWLLYQRVWIPAILIALNYFVAGPLAVKLNPRFFLQKAVQQGADYEVHAELRAVDSVCEKLYSEIPTLTAEPTTPD